MPRYEFSEGGLQGSHKFWEITLAGASFTTRYGRIGTRGQSNTKRFGSDLEARAAHDAIIREKLNKGYRLVEGAMNVVDAVPVAAAENPELMAAVLRDPDDEQAWLVYGDWLQSQGDPRGELIALQNAMKKESDPARFVPLSLAQNALFTAHQRHFFGPLADHLGLVKLTWRNGYFHTAKIPVAGASRPAALRALLASPSARVLQELTIEAIAAHLDDLPVLVDALAEACPPTLRSLSIRRYSEDIVPGGDLSRVFARSPALRKLLVHGQLALGVLKLPELRRFEVANAADSVMLAASIAHAVWPKIEQITIDAEWSPDVVRALAPFFDGEGVPELRQLTLTGPDSPRALRAAIDSHVVARLTHLTSNTGMIDAKLARRLVASKPRLANLKHLGLGAMARGTSEEDFDSLRALCPDVSVYRTN